MAEIEHFCDPSDKSHPKFDQVREATAMGNLFSNSKFIWLHFRFATSEFCCIPLATKWTAKRPSTKPLERQLTDGSLPTKLWHILWLGFKCTWWKSAWIPRSYVSASTWATKWLTTPATVGMPNASLPTYVVQRWRFSVFQPIFCFASVGLDRMRRLCWSFRLRSLAAHQGHWCFSGSHAPSSWTQDDWRRSLGIAEGRSGQGLQKRSQGYHGAFGQNGC